MAFDISDIFAALATGDPYAGRKMRLNELQQSQWYDINNRNVNLAEMMGPLEREAFRQNIDFRKEMNPRSLAQADQFLKMLRDEGGEAGDATDKMDKAAKNLQSVGKELAGMTPAGAAERLAKMIGLGTAPSPVLPPSVLGIESAALPSFPGMPTLVPPLGARVRSAMVARQDAESLARNAELANRPQLGPPSPLEALMQPSPAADTGNTLFGIIGRALAPPDEAAVMQFIRDFAAQEPDLARTVFERAGIKSEADLAGLSLKDLRRLRIAAIEARNLNRMFERGVLR